MSIRDVQGGYSVRTQVTGSLGFTVTISYDLDSPGQWATKRSAKIGYYAIDASMPFFNSNENTARHALAIIQKLKKLNCRTLNIAGSSMHTIKKSGSTWTQSRITNYVHDLVSRIHSNYRLDKIVSGGQSGVDISGLVVAHALGIPYEGIYPKGFMVRLIDGRDVFLEPEQILQEIRLEGENFVPFSDNYGHTRGRA